MGKLEAYLAGQPLSEENAALQRGENPEEQSPDFTAAPGGLRDLTNDEREWLRRLTVEPGWPILMRLLENAIAEREQRAIVLSQTDPIKNQAEMTKAWTYLAAHKEVVMGLRARVQHEIQLFCRGKVEQNGEVLGE